MTHYDLSESEWRLIQPLLPNKTRGVPRVDDRRVLNGIFYILRTGAPWRDLPDRYGPYSTAYNRYNRWARAGVWLRIFDAIAHEFPQALGFLNSSVIQGHELAAKGKIGARITPTAVQAKA